MLENVFMLLKMYDFLHWSSLWNVSAFSLLENFGVNHLKSQAFLVIKLVNHIYHLIFIFVVKN